MRRWGPPAFVLAFLLAAAGSAAATDKPAKIGLRNEACRVNLIKECVNEKRAEVRTTCAPDKDKPSKFNIKCGTALGATPNFINECKAYVEEWYYDSCIDEIDIATLADGAAIRAEIAETNRAIRQDYRSLLNQLCRAVATHPDKCDDALGPVAK